MRVQRCMMTRYDAFISYNHNPRDIKITGRLQQKLEHYKVPDTVKSGTGKKKIERVFLDRGELEVAGDLNEEILNALRNTDYLIVVCSPEGYASPWVRREIEFFLSCNTRDHILTVLTEGEPADVIPEELRFREVTDADGNKVTEPVEPLACDYRLPEKEADKTELPRLVAAIIGCRYDDLVQRHKQYRQKIMTRIAAGAAALMTLLSGYMIWNNHKLQVSYDNTLIEQSKSLALQSQQALAQGDRIDAVKYAVQALPSAEQDRPLVFEAKKSLVKALNLYKKPGNAAESAMREYKGYIGDRLIDNTTVRTILPVDRDGEKYLCALYGNGKICFWNTAAGEQVDKEYSEKLDQDGITVMDAAADTDGSIVIAHRKGIICFDVASGKEISRMDLEETDTYYQSAAENLCCLDGTAWFAAETEAGIAGKKIIGVDTATGKVVFEYLSDMYPKFLAPSPGGKTAAGVFTEFGDTFDGTTDKDHLMILGPSKSDVRDACEKKYIASAKYFSKEQLIISALDRAPQAGALDLEKVVKFGEVGSVLNMNAAEHKTFHIVCMDPDAGTETWDTELTGVFSSSPEIGSKDGPEAMEGLIPCTIGRNLYYFDAEGRVKHSIDLGTAVMTYYGSQAQTDRLFAVLIDGSRSSSSVTESNVYNVFDMFHAPVTDAAYDGRSLFIVCTDTASETNEERIIEYNDSDFDTKWASYDGLPETPSDIEAVTAYGDSFISVIEKSLDEPNSRGGNHDTIINTFDSRTGEQTEKDVRFEHPEHSEYTYAGIDSKNGKVYLLDTYSSETQIAAVDVTSGEIVEKKLSQNLRDDSDRGSYVSVDDGKTVLNILSAGPESDDYFAEDYCIRVMKVDTETGKAKYIKLCDLTPEEMDSYSTGTYDRCSYHIDPKGHTVTIFKGGKLVEFDLDTGEEVSTTELGEVQPVAFAKGVNDELLVITREYDGFNLHVYDSKTHKETASAFLGVMNYYGDSPEVSELSDGSMLLDMGHAALILEPSTYSRLAMMTGVAGYNKETSELCMELDDGTLGHVPYRELDDMVAEAAEFIGDTEAQGDN